MEKNNFKILKNENTLKLFDNNVLEASIVYSLRTSAKKYFYLSSIGVRHKGKKYFKNLLKELESICNEKNIQIIRLTIGRGSEYKHAREVYRHLGFHSSYDEDSSTSARGRMSMEKIIY